MDNKYKQQEIHSFLDQNKKKDYNIEETMIKLQFQLYKIKLERFHQKHFLAIQNLKYFVFDLILKINQQLQVQKLLNQGCSDGTVKIFNIATGKLAFNLQGSSEGSTPTTSIRWRKDCANKVKSVVINVNSDGSIMFWQAQTGKQLHRLVEKNNQILCMDLRLDGEVFATSGKDCKIRIYDDEKKEIIHTFDSADQQKLNIHNPQQLNRTFKSSVLSEILGGISKHISFLWLGWQFSDLGSKGQKKCRIYLRTPCFRRQHRFQVLIKKISQPFINYLLENQTINPYKDSNIFGSPL